MERGKRERKIEGGRERGRERNGQEGRWRGRKEGRAGGPIVAIILGAKQASISKKSLKVVLTVFMLLVSF